MAYRSYARRRRNRKRLLFKKVRNKWKRFRGNPFKKNVAEGFYDKGGTFHPIRASSDYSASRAGEGGGGGKRKARKKKKAKKAKRRKR